MRAVGPLLGGLAALSLSMYAIAKEAPVLTYGDQESLTTTMAIVRGELGSGFSFYGQKRLMAACMQGMTGFWFSLAAPEQRKAHAENCLGHALSYAENTPLESLTWTVAARASFVLGDHDGLNRYLGYARRSAPNEQWVAGLRVNLAEDALAALSDINRLEHDQDLSLMVLSRKGISAIAGRYWANEGFRERITAVVEKMPNEDQRRFVSSVRRAAHN
ncbi:hypothetical protein D4A92_22785 (plasmid) [Rhizobium rosettiformans]|uniref:Sel1 repeat family protein n=1 Tax=Rhizobium rosettiformans TaxID=1368430 RepID=A0ABX7F3P2_9HYPH|nr:hypothetical protein [Rhizobium rosettiformans]QRF54347.1 hypothetical protein D4A92_22785 [Rhizobium rosettiformans]